MKHLTMILLCLVVRAPIYAQGGDKRALPRVVVTDFFNTSKERHTIMLRSAADALAIELTKAGAYEVVARQEVDRVASRLKMTAQMREEDFVAIAKQVGATLLVIGELRYVDWYTKDKAREVEVGIIVRVKDIASGEFVNGAAERGTNTDLPGGKKPDGVMLVDAAGSAVYRAAAKMASYRPIEATVMNTAGRGLVVINRGTGHGVRGKQEFLVIRDGAIVGRLKAFQVFPSHSEMTVVDNRLGIRPEDRALSVFPEPKFGK